MDLPLKTNRQTPSVETREHYNVKARGYQWVSPGKTWKVDVSKVVNDQSQTDQVLYDHVRKKSYSHNKYYPRHQSKVNKSFRLWKMDLDREQYNHLRIPVNHSVSWMAPVFNLRSDKAPKKEFDLDKMIRKEVRECRKQAGPHQSRHTPIEHALPELSKEVKYINERPSLKSRVKKYDRDHLSGLELVENMPSRQVGASIKGKTRYTDIPSEQVKLVDRLAVENRTNARSQFTKVDTEFDAQKHILDEMLEVSKQLTPHKNRNEGYKPTYHIERSLNEDVQPHGVGERMLNMDRIGNGAIQNFIRK